jgi:hypothetical protein
MMCVSRRGLNTFHQTKLGPAMSRWRKPFNAKRFALPL